MTTDAKWSDLASLDAPKMIAAANRLLPAWVSLLLVVVIAWQLARIIWMLIPGPSAGDAVPAPAADIAQLGTSGNSADVNAIANAQSPIRIAVVDAETNETIDGFSFEDCQQLLADAVEQVVNWKDGNRVRIVHNRPIRLQFQLLGEQARMFGFAWK